MGPEVLWASGYHGDRQAAPGGGAPTAARQGLRRAGPVPAPTHSHLPPPTPTCAGQHSSQGRTRQGWVTLRTEAGTLPHSASPQQTLVWLTRYPWPAILQPPFSSFPGASPAGGRPGGGGRPCPHTPALPTLPDVHLGSRVGAGSPSESPPDPGLLRLHPCMQQLHAGF